MEHISGEPTHARHPSQEATLCGLPLEGLLLVQALVDADCTACVANIKPEHVVHFGDPDLSMGIGEAACGADGSVVTINQVSAVNCALCLAAVQSTVVTHIADPIDEFTLCGIGSAVESVHTVPAADATCGSCQDKYNEHMRLAGLAEEILVAPSDPFDVIKVGIAGRRTRVEQGDRLAVVDHPSSDEAIRYFSDVAAFARTHGYRNVLAARVESVSDVKRQIETAADRSFGTPIGLLREWYGLWEADENAPSKLPGSLHTRTAALLSLHDKG